MWTILNVFYLLGSNAVIIILLQNALIYLFGSKYQNNIFLDYVVPSVLFWGIYYIPFHSHHFAPIPYFYYYLCTTMVSIIWAFFFVQENMFKKLPYILFYYSAYRCFKFILGNLYETENTMNPRLYKLLDILSWIIIVFCLYLLIKLYKRYPLKFTQKTTPRQNIFLCFYPFIVFIILQLADPSLNIPYQVFIPVSSLLLLLNLPVFYFIYAETFINFEAKEQLSKALSETTAQLTRYRYTILIEEQARRERHELKNKYFYIQSLLRENKLEKLDTFLTEYIGSLSEDMSMIHTNNTLIDHILNTKLALAKKNHIKTYSEILIPEQLQFQEEYFCTILLNLLDNAIEASKKEKDPDLQIYLSTKNNYLVCCIKNRATHTFFSDGKDLITTKRDKSAHGHGIKIIKNTIKKVNGIFDVSMECDYFVATVMFPLTN